MIRLVIGTAIVLIAVLAILAVLNIIPTGVFIDYAKRLGLIGAIIVATAVALGLLLRPRRS